MDNALPLWIGAHEAESRYGIKAATVRSWAARRRLAPRGLDDFGRPLYATVDVLRLDAQRSMPKAA